MQLLEVVDFQECEHVFRNSTSYQLTQLTCLFSLIHDLIELHISQKLKPKGRVIMITRRQNLTIGLHFHSVGSVFWCPV